MFRPSFPSKTPVPELENNPIVRFLDPKFGVDDAGRRDLPVRRSETLSSRSLGSGSRVDRGLDGYVVQKEVDLTELASEDVARDVVSGGRESSPARV